MAYLMFFWLTVSLWTLNTDCAVWYRGYQITIYDSFGTKNNVPYEGGWMIMTFHPPRLRAENRTSEEKQLNKSMKFELLLNKKVIKSHEIEPNDEEMIEHRVDFTKENAESTFGEYRMNIGTREMFVAELSYFNIKCPFWYLYPDDFCTFDGKKIVINKRMSCGVRYYSDDDGLRACDTHVADQLSWCDALNKDYWKKVNQLTNKKCKNSSDDPWVHIWYGSILYFNDAVQAKLNRKVLAASIDPQFEGASVQCNITASNGTLIESAIKNDTTERSGISVHHRPPQFDIPERLFNVADVFKIACTYTKEDRLSLHQFLLVVYPVQFRRNCTGYKMSNGFSKIKCSFEPPPSEMFDLQTTCKCNGKRKTVAGLEMEVMGDGTYICYTLITFKNPFRPQPRLSYIYEQQVVIPVQSLASTGRPPQPESRTSDTSTSTFTSRGTSKGCKTNYAILITLIIPLIPQ